MMNLCQFGQDLAICLRGREQARSFHCLFGLCDALRPTGQSTLFSVMCF